MNIVIAGARERKETDGDKDLVTALVQGLVQKYQKQLHVLSVGCDKGIGKIVRDHCMKSNVVFVEVRIKFEGEEIPRIFFAHMFLARNAALLEVGDEFHIFRGPNQNGIVEALIAPARGRVGPARVNVYEEAAKN